MLHENIRKYRKEKGLSQEELAQGLHVVRQTVSKWENGLSVPDAETLVHMAAFLEVPVSKLLGIEDERQDNDKRGLILFLCFASMLAALLVKDPVISVLLSGGCILFAVIVLYRNLPLMTSTDIGDMGLKTLRLATIVDLLALFLGVVLAVLTAADVISFSEQGEKMFAMLLVASVMVFVGILSPKLPFTKHTGLRLPWTVQDQETWDLAHRILAYISFPLALLYAGCSLTLDGFEQVTLAAMLLWVGIPGGISYHFFWKKVHGKR